MARKHDRILYHGKFLQQLTHLLFVHFIEVAPFNSFRTKNAGKLYENTEKPKTKPINCSTLTVVQLKLNIRVLCYMKMAEVAFASNVAYSTNIGNRKRNKESKQNQFFFSFEYFFFSKLLKFNKKLEFLFFFSLSPSSFRQSCCFILPTRSNSAVCLTLFSFDCLFLFIVKSIPFIRYNRLCMRFVTICFFVCVRFAYILDAAILIGAENRLA